MTGEAPAPVTTPPVENGVMRFFGGCLVALGAIFGLLSGGCTAFFAGTTLLDPGASGDARGYATVFLMLGAVVFIPSLIAVVLGMWLWRKGARRPPMAP